MTNKAYDSSNKVSEKNQNKASKTRDIKQESWVNKTTQENNKNKASEGTKSSFELLSHNKEKANNLVVVSVKVADLFEDFENTK
ncbi:13083_t:CDS:1, partial [Dentiscutata erythropus]